MTNMGGPQMWNMRALLDMIEPASDDNATHETAPQQEGFGRARRRPQLTSFLRPRFVFAALVSKFMK